MIKMYDSDLDAYLLDEDTYNALITQYTSGYEDWGYDDDYGYYIVAISDDSILAAFNLGDYSGGSIVINQSQQGGAM